MNTLSQLHSDIETRVTTTLESQPDWLCREGCDGCCRRLAEVPSITAQEWALLQTGLAALPPEQLQAIGRAISALASQTTRPVICPMLDRDKGACTVYPYRPVACRTYGFYVQRDLGLYCKDIEAQVDKGDLAEVVWGNHDVIDQRLSRLGESRELTEWFALWKEDVD